MSGVGSTSFGFNHLRCRSAISPAVAVATNAADISVEILLNALWPLKAAVNLDENGLIPIREPDGIRRSV
jgi:hypothetical protein